MTEDKACRDLLAEDGENRAVRCFLGMYQCGGNPSVKAMKIHLEHSGFNDCWPDWVTDQKNAGHLTKGGAQDWLRYLFALEGRAAKPAVPVPLPSQENVRELAEEYCDVREEYERDREWRFNYPGLQNFAVALLSAAPPLPVVQGWISVKDRLPEDGQTVAFVVDCKNPNWDHLHGRVLGGLYLGTKNGGFSVPGLTLNASHWMPLPAALTPPAAPKEPT